MTVLDFIKKYNTLNSTSAKDKMIESIIRRTYCPILEKRVVLQKMLEKSTVVDNDSGVYYIDLYTSKINHTMALLILYTDLEINMKNEQEGSLIRADEIYDVLISYDLLNKICEKIGEKEIKELSDVNNMLMENFYNKYATVQATLGRIIKETISQLATFFEGAIDEIQK